MHKLVLVQAMLRASLRLLLLMLLLALLSGGDVARAAAPPVLQKVDPSTINHQPSTTHWAFKAPVRPRPPETKNKRWRRNPIDQFILAQLEKENLKPSPEADKITLLR